MGFHKKHLDKMLMWLMTVVMLLPNFLGALSSVTAATIDSQGVVDSILYDGPDGHAKVSAKLSVDGTKVEWEVTLNKDPTEVASSQKLEVDVGGGGLSAPHTISSNVKVETKERIAQIKKEGFTLEAETNLITFVTDVLNTTLSELTLKMAVATVTEETASNIIIHTSPQTKTLTINIPLKEEPLPVEEVISEEPVIEESVIEEPVIEETVEEEIVVEEPTVEEVPPVEEVTTPPVVEEIPEEVVKEEPVVEEPAPEESVLEIPKTPAVPLEQQPAEEPEKDIVIDPEDPIALVETIPIPWAPIPQYTFGMKLMQTKSLKANKPSPLYTNNSTTGIFPTNHTQSDTNIKNYDPQRWEYEEGFLTKYATQTSTAGQFDINLKVEGKTITSTETIDIVIVYDNSNSMSENGRFNSAKTATQNFIDGLLNPTTNSNGNIRIALVSFGENLIPNNSLYTFEKNANSLKSILPRSANGGGTNTQAGLIKAAEIMATSTATTKVVVVISDGVPTYSYKATNSVVNNPSNGIRSYQGMTTPSRRGSSFNNRLGDGTTFDLDSGFLGFGREIYTINNYEVEDHGWATMSQAVLMKNAGLEIYGLGIQISSGANASENEALNVMKNIASPEKFYNASQVNQISTILADIANQISKSIINGVIEDPMGDMVALNTGSNNAFDPNDYTLSGSPGLNLSSVTVAVDANGKILLNNLNLGKNEWVNLKYTVNVKTENSNFKSDFYYQTNGRTTLTPKAINPNQKLDFPIPSVKAPGKLIAGTKKWENDSPTDRPQSITLQLKRYTGTNIANAVNVGLPKEVKASENWAYTFGTYPAFSNKGQTYTYIIEEMPVPGYTASYDEYNVTNRRLATQLLVKKVRDDGTAIIGPGMEATFRLSDHEGTLITLVDTNPATGIATITDLQEGTYFLNEFEAPIGYITDRTFTYRITVTRVGDKLQVVVTSGNDDIHPHEPLTITNHKQMIEIPVLKFWEDNDDALGLRPESITVYLYQDYEEGDAPIDTITITPDAFDNWESKFKALPAYDDNGNEYTYTIREAEVAHYNSEVDGTIIRNTIKVGKLTITKIDKTDLQSPILLDGAEFELRDAENNVIASGITSDGILEFTNIPYGTYTLVETKAPDGYSLPNSHWDITVGGDAEQHVEIEITNEKKQILPKTGGMGTTIFTIAGLSLMGLSAIYFRKNKNNSDTKKGEEDND